ncbi:MAG: EAL domain-containing protein [Paucibacter sp.]|nr:EAL domain-containing protein [Roseateles sp.]
MNALIRLVSRLRIATRLRASFALLLALPLLLAALSWQRQQALSHAYAHVVNEQADLLFIANEVNESATDAARKLLVLMGGAPENRQRARLEIDAAEQRLQDAAGRMRAHRGVDENAEQELDELLGNLRVFRSELAVATRTLDDGRNEAAREWRGSRLEPALSALVSETRVLRDSARRATVEELRRLGEEIERDGRLTLLYCGIALASGALLAVLVARSVVRPLEEAEGGALAIASGDYEHRVCVEAQDELGQLSASLNALALAVGERQSRLLELAGTDALTGMATRTRFAAMAGERLRQAADTPYALVCMDVDRLKTVNSVLGFDAGDSLLLGLAGRLEQLQGQGAIVGRLSGGTFVVLLPVDGHADWQFAVAQLHASLNHRHQWRGQALDLTVSIGVALCPGHGRHPEALMQRAEQAMFEAKRRRSEIALYDPEQEADRLSHLSLLSELEAAIAQGQLRQFLQPKRSLHDDTIAGAEALVRWQHPERGWLPPNEFVPFAESTGRIRQITQWMLEQAVATLAAWRQQGRELPIAVNISTLDLQDGLLPARIEAMLDRAGVPAHLLQLELTETGLMTSAQDPIHVMHSLRRLGVRLAIDDFGTGQSSLAYLQRLPVHEIKIDRSFVGGVDQDPKRQELLGSIITLGHGLGLQVTAEGVETQAELEVLQGLGCNLAQGYLLAKPMDLRHFDAWCTRAQDAEMS